MRRSALAGACALLVLLPAPAAARELRTGFMDPLFADPGAHTRAVWLDRTRQAGASFVRLEVNWAVIAGPGPPANGADPSDPSYDFSLLDGAVRDARTRGLEPILTVGTAPAWAEGPGRPAHTEAPPGSWKPDPGAFGRFGRALAARYSGAFDPPGSAPTLPRVRHYQALNEPNLWTYLSPQWSGGRLTGPRHYRSLLNAFYPQVKAVHASNVVLSAGTAPYGSRPGGKRTRPIAFWKSLLCVKEKRGKLRPRRRCPAPAQLDVVAHHPITGAPTSRAAHAGDVTIPELSRLRRMVRVSERGRNVLPAGRRPLWVTELWWETNPPERVVHTSPRQQARWIAEGLYLIWRQRIRVTILFLIRDQPYVPALPLSTYQSGIYFVNGRRKPAVRAVRFPFVTKRRSDGRLAVWGRSPHSGRLTVQRRVHGDWRRLRRVRARSGRVFQATVGVRGGAVLRARVGGESSRPWRQRG